MNRVRVAPTQLVALRAGLASLSDRERDVVALVVKGKMNKQIAHGLGTSERTSKAHRHSVVQKLQVRATAELASIAERLAMIAHS